MNDCSCQASSNDSIIDIKLITARWKKLRDIYSVEDYPAEKILRHGSGIDAVAVGKEDGQEGHLIVSTFGFEYWIHWSFSESIPLKEGGEQFTLTANLFFPLPERLIEEETPVKKWTFDITCDEVGNCIADVKEEEVRRLFCGGDDRDLYSPMQLVQDSSKKVRRRCTCEKEHQNSWCTLRCWWEYWF